MESIFNTLSELQSESLLFIRIVLSIVFIYAARNKSKDIRAFSRHNDLPVPVAYGVMFAEAAGGTGLLLGIFPRIASLGIIFLMLGSISLHLFKWNSPYWATEGGWEYDLMILVMASVILTFGAGVYTLYAPF